YGLTRRTLETCRSSLRRDETFIGVILKRLRRSARLRTERRKSYVSIRAVNIWLLREPVNLLTRSPADIGGYRFVSTGDAACESCRCKRLRRRHRPAPRLLRPSCHLPNRRQPRHRALFPLP